MDHAVHVDGIRWAGEHVCSSRVQVELLKSLNTTNSPEELSTRQDFCWTKMILTANRGWIYLLLENNSAYEEGKSTHTGATGTHWLWDSCLLFTCRGKTQALCKIRFLISKVESSIMCVLKRLQVWVLFPWWSGEIWREGPWAWAKITCRCYHWSIFSFLFGKTTHHSFINRIRGG